ncbi:hypothetical protein V8F20_000301 [Naviculisporaceae sp. PSN 640]
MSGRKLLTLGLVIGIGVLNGYYVFEPTFREHAQGRKALDLNQADTDNKAKASNAPGKPGLSDKPAATKTDQ